MSGGLDPGLLELLRLLRQANGYVSGEKLAASLGLTRMGVWKRLHRLKSLGYTISGERRRGYRLVAAPDKLFPAEILHDLQTRRFLGPVHYFASTASTNDTAKQLGILGAPEGTLVVAESQTKGRGRAGRHWHSPPETGIYVSLLLRPPLPPQELPQITLSAAVAVVRALRRAAGISIGIKWPNDLILNGKKLGGILTEMETDSDQIRYLVVGLGVNVNTAEFPPELRALATSLGREFGRPFPRLPILKAWLEEFEIIYEDFLNRGFPAILAEWRKHSVTLGKMVALRQGSRLLEGLAWDVAEDGALLLKTHRGEMVRVTSGEITLETALPDRPGIPEDDRGKMETS